MTIMKSVAMKLTAFLFFVTAVVAQSTNSINTKSAPIIIGFDSKNNVVVLNDDLVDKLPLSGEAGEVIVNLSTVLSKIVAASSSGTALSIDSSKVSFKANPDRLLINAGKDLWIYKFASEEVARLTETPTEEKKFAEFSPNGDFVSYIAGSNIYIVDVKAAKPIAYQLTQDGSSLVANGFIRWAYDAQYTPSDLFEADSQERKTYSWSPDSAALVFTKYDRSVVPKNKLRVDYNRPSGENGAPEVFDLRYPRVGDPFPVIGIGFVRLNTPAMTALRPQAAQYNGTPNKTVNRAVNVEFISRPLKSSLVGGLDWTSPEEFLIQLTDLDQKSFNLYNFKLPSLTQKQSDISKASAVFDGFGKTATNYIVARSNSYALEVSGMKKYVLQLEIDGNNGLYICDPKDPEKVFKSLTPDMQVKTIVDVDAERKIVYFTASSLVNPSATNLYKYDLVSDKATPITAGKGNTGATLDLTKKFAVVLSEDLRSSAMLTMKKTDSTIEINPASPEESKLISPRFDTVETTSGKTSYAVLLPKDFKEDFKYKTVFYVDPIPMAPGIANKWNPSLNALFEKFLEKDYIVVVCNGRVVGEKGKTFNGSGVSTPWSENLSEVIASIIKSKSATYIDEERVAVLGWNYGGYLTLHAALDGGTKYKAAVALNPITDLSQYSLLQSTRLLSGGAKKQSIVDKVAFSAGTFTTPTLVLHSSQNETVLVEQSVRVINGLQTRAGNGGGSPLENLSTVFYEKSDSTNNFSKPEEKRFVYDQVIRFIDNAVGSGRRIPIKKEPSIPGPVPFQTDQKNNGQTPGGNSQPPSIPPSNGTAPPNESDKSKSKDKDKDKKDDKNKDKKINSGEERPKVVTPDPPKTPPDNNPGNR